MAKLWLIGNERGCFPRLAAQFAALRGMSSGWCSTDGMLAELPLGADSLVALRFDRLPHLGPAARAALKAGLRRGATIYVRGGAAPGRVLCTAPFYGPGLAVARHTEADSYRLTGHPMLPAALAEERVSGAFSLPGVAELPPTFEPVLLAACGARARAVIFVMREGAGAVIFDLNSDECTGDCAIVFRLADPSQRAANLGALLAVDRAGGRDPRRPVAFNLTLDDRPANYDYLNAAHLIRFLDRVHTRLPGACVDFSWTPSQSHPSRRYVEVLKHFGAGFLWHGLARHVAHEALANPDAEMAAGQRLVERIQRRYEVRFQPVMVFPFERADAQCIELLCRYGFCGLGLSLLARDPLLSDAPDYLRYSMPQRVAPNGPAILRRQAIERLPRDLMLAHAALGLPVLGLAHPNDFALKRVPRPWACDSYEELEGVLEFAVSKSLRPRSLEQIAVELVAAPPA